MSEIDEVEELRKEVVRLRGVCKQYKSHLSDLKSELITLQKMHRELQESHWEVCRRLEREDE